MKALPEHLYWNETYPTKIREKLQELLRAAWSKTKANTIYHERMQYMNDATARFFKLGKHFDTAVKMQTKSNKAPNVKVDGNLQEWAGIKPIIFKESMTGKETKIKTEFFVANDDKNLYIAGKVYEPDKMILPKGKIPHDSDEIYGNDSIEMFFCPIKLGDREAKFNNASRFYQIILNARGDVFDVHRPIYKKPNPKFTLKFEHAQKPMGKGWQFEVKIPFKSIDAMKPTPGMTWPVNFYRSRKRNDGSERYYAWSPTMGSSFFDTSTFGVLEFPRKALYNLKYKPGNPWHNKMKGATYSKSYENGKAILKGKISKDVPAGKKKPSAVFTGVYDITFAKPVIASMQARYSGHGVKKITFLIRSQDWQIMKTSYTPKEGEVIKNKVINFEVSEATKNVKGKNVKIDKISHFKWGGLQVVSFPGAEFTIEAGNIIITEK